MITAYIELAAIFIISALVIYFWIIPKIMDAFDMYLRMEEHRMDAWMQEREDFEAWRQSRTDLVRVREER